MGFFSRSKEKKQGQEQAVWSDGAPMRRPLTEKEKEALAKAQQNEPETATFLDRESPKGNRTFRRARRSESGAGFDFED